MSRALAELMGRRLGEMYQQLVLAFEMDRKMRAYAVQGRSLSSRNVNDAIKEFNHELNRGVTDVLGRGIDAIYTTIERPDNRRRMVTYLTTSITVQHTSWELNFGLGQQDRDYAGLHSVIFGSDVQTANLRDRTSQPYYATGAMMPKEARYAWSRRTDPGDIVADLGFLREVMGEFVDHRPNPPLMMVPRKCTSCKTSESYIGSEWCTSCSTKLRPLKDAVDWLVMTLTTIANAMTLSLGAGLSMQPIFVATRKRYFLTSEVWQAHVTGLTRPSFGVCAHHGLIAHNPLVCPLCADEKARRERLELVMQWLVNACRVFMRLVWEQVDVSQGRAMLLETGNARVTAEDAPYDGTRFSMLEIEKTKVIAEDVYDDTRYQLLELS